ncbi:MAG: ATP synthase F1 subunit delta [Proteobacteria bacterium]|nr:ATP synthase F1 subunit delta [Pseudomonadota bacterium]
MSSNTTAQKYAEALFGIGKSSGKLAVFQANAEDFSKILENAKDLKTALSHPNIRRVQRKAILDGILSGCSYDPVFANFLRLVVDRGRIQYFSKIVASFAKLRDEADGRVRGVVYVAAPMNASQRERLRQKVQQSLGKEVVIEERIDPDIIGGLRLEVDGRVYDSSLQRHLERMREAMLERSEL